MQFHNYINGRWVEKSNKFLTVNPANEEILAEVAQAEVSDVEDAVQAADVFTEWKSIYVDYSGKLMRAQIDNREE